MEDQLLPRKRLVDHTLVAWMLENLSIIGIALSAFLAKSCVPIPQYEKRSFVNFFLSSIVGGLVVIEGSIAVQKILVEKVYAHVPYFTEAGKRLSLQPWRKTFWDWLSCNMVTHVLTSGVVSGILMAEPEMVYKGRLLRLRERFKPHHFLLKLAAVRFVSDIVFYAVHRALHTKALYFLHKRHHEHTATTLNTNFHFFWPDLLLEGFTPILAGVIVLEAMKVKIVGMEELLLATYFQWYEIGSHSGKPVPTITLFPPLSPLYKWAFGEIDKRNIEFHDRHHALRNCNYGISQWLDYLIGTARFNLDKDTSWPC